MRFLQLVCVTIVGLAASSTLADQPACITPSFNPTPACELLLNDLCAEFKEDIRTCMLLSYPNNVYCAMAAQAAYTTEYNLTVTFPPCDEDEDDDDPVPGPDEAGLQFMKIMNQHEPHLFRGVDLWR